MIDPRTLAELESALADLPSREMFLVALVERRDAQVAGGKYQLARVWQAVAVLLTEIDDTERDTLRALDLGLS